MSAPRTGQANGSTWLLASTLLLTISPAALAVAAASQELRLENPSLPNTEFHVFLNQLSDSQQASEAYCRERQLTTASTREVRFFWKQLPYNMSFYLGSRIEMTTDHPEIERGEVLCFPLRRVSGPGPEVNDMHVLHRKIGSNSCRVSVTSVLCKRQLLRSNCTDQLLPLGGNEQSKPGPSNKGQSQQQLKQGDQQVTFNYADGSVCLGGPLFWTLATGTGALLLLLTVAASILAACSVRFKRQLNKSFDYRCLSRQASARLMRAKPSGGGSHMSGVALDTDDGGGFFL